MNSILKGSIFVSILILTSTVFGQKKYEKISETDGVVFYGKMKPSKCLQKDSPLKLMIKVENTNDQAVNCEMTISFFDTGVLREESEPIIFCIKANKTAKGKKKGLQLVSAESTNAEMKDKASTYEVTEVKITKTANCK